MNAEQHSTTTAHGIEPVDREESQAPRRRGAGTRTLVVAATAVVAVAATVGVVNRLQEHEPSTGVVAVAPPPAEAPADGRGDEAALEDLTRQLLDRSIEPTQRAELVADDGRAQPTAAAILESLDSLGGASGLSITEVVGIDIVGSVATVDADIGFGSGPVTSVRLMDLVAERVDGGWRFTRGTLCGLARQAVALGSVPTCDEPTSLTRQDGAADLTASLLGAVGPSVDPASAPAVVTGWWGTEVHSVGSDWWFVDYPEEELGGGGPVGPADLVRADARGTETARVRLEGTDATVLAGEDTVWVTHQVTDPADGEWWRVLTAVDARTAQVLTERRLASSESPVAERGGDLFLLDGTQLHVDDGRSLQRTRTVDLPDPYFPDRTGRAPEAIWFSNDDGHALIVSTNDLSMQEVAVPQGQLVLSGANAWTVRSGTAGTTLELAGSPSAGATIEHLALDTAWGDGRGGVWVVGEVGLGADAPASNAMAVEVVSPQVAVHLDANGATDSTWTLHDPGRSSWFAAAGGGLGLAAGDRVTIIEPQP